MSSGDIAIPQDVHLLEAERGQRERPAKNLDGQPSYANQPQIPPEEFRQRRSNALQAAKERDLDCLIVWSRGSTTVDWYGDVYYLANYVTPWNQLGHIWRDSPNIPWTGRGSSVLILPVDSSPVLVVEVTDYPRDQVRVEDVQFTVHVPELVARILKERHLDKGRLGLAGRETLLLSTYRLLVEEIGHEIRLEPADDILQRLRLIKSDNELRALRRAGQIGAQWLAKTLEAAEPGRTEAEFVAEGMRFLLSNGGYPYDIAVGSGAGCQSFFGRRNGTRLWDSTTPLQNGDIVHVDAWGPIDGYYTDIARSALVGGTITEAQRDIFEATQAIVDHIILGVKPGVAVGELYERGASWLPANGFGSFLGSQDQANPSWGQMYAAFGHGVGLGLENPWIIEGEPTILEPNMVMAAEFFMSVPGVGAAKYERNFLVTEDGYEFLDAECPVKWWD